MSKKATTIKLGLVELSIVGDYTKATKGDNINPSCPAEWSTNRIQWNGNDVTDLLNETLSDEQKKSIEEKCIEQITNY